MRCWRIMLKKTVDVKTLTVTIHPVKLTMDTMICGKIYITYFKCKDTCVSSVNKKHKNHYNRNQHQRPYNASSKYPCQRACCLCKSENK